MAELFGSRAEFAIEAGIEPDLCPPSTVWGHMCVWCRGIALGDIEDRYCGLGSAYERLGEVVSSIDHLWAEELVGLEDVAAWNFLDGLLYGYHGDVELADARTLEECRRDAVRWGRFNFLTNWGEQFDGHKSFIMRPPSGPVRILSRRLPGNMGLSVEVSRDGFVAAVEGFARWFEEQELRLGRPEFELQIRPQQDYPLAEPYFPEQAVAYLQAAQFNPTAFPCLEVHSDSFFWSDEAYLEFAAVCHSYGCQSFRDPLVFRSSMIRGQPNEACRRAWEELMRLCPEWPGFRPERRCESLRAELERQLAEK